MRGLMEGVRNAAAVGPMGNEAFLYVPPNKLTAEFGTWQGVVGRGESFGHRCLCRGARGSSLVTVEESLVLMLERGDWQEVEHLLMGDVPLKLRLPEPKRQFLQAVRKRAAEVPPPPPVRRGGSRRAGGAITGGCPLSDANRGTTCFQKFRAPGSSLGSFCLLKSETTQKCHAQSYERRDPKILR